MKYYESRQNYMWCLNGVFGSEGKFLWRMLGTVLASRMRNRRIYDTHHRSLGNLAEWAPTERGCPGFPAKDI